MILRLHAKTPGFVFLLLILIAGASWAAPAATGHGYVDLPKARELLASLGVQEPVVAYADFPFPDVPDGELWRPTPDYRQEVTAVVPSGNTSRYPAEATRILAEAQRLANAGQGVAATALLEQHAATIPDGMAYSYLAWIYQVGKGDQPANPQRALEHHLRFARSNPRGYESAGKMPHLTTSQRLHYLSKGLSRGCRGCARWLLESKSSGKRGESRHDVPIDLRLLYALVAVEIGDEMGPRLLDTVVLELKKDENRRGVAPELLELAASLERHAYDLAGTSRFGGVREPTYALFVADRIRTGLVPGDLLEAVALADAGDPTSAVSQLLHNQARGPLTSRVINRVMARATYQQVGEVARTSLELTAAEWGDPYRWAAAALAEHANLERVVKAGSELKRVRGTRSGRSDEARKADAESFTALALASPATPAPIRTLLMRMDSAMAAKRSAGNVRECLERVMASEHPPSMLFTCEGMMTWAWENTTELDFGVLSDDWFARLARQASDLEAATLRQRRKDDVDARLGALNAQRDAEDRRLAASGLARVPLNSQQALTQARDDVAWANAGASARAAQGVPSYQAVIERLHRGFIDKRNRGSAGRSDALRQAVADGATAEVCADWGYRYMVECPNRRP